MVEAMRLVLVRENAEFDTIAAALATALLLDGQLLGAQRLGSSVRAFLTTYPILPLTTAPHEANELILVEADTPPPSFPASLPTLLVGREPPRRPLAAHERLLVAPVGATTTVATSALLARGAGLTPKEATLLLLGILEATGGLASLATTDDDRRCVAALLAQGADAAAPAAWLCLDQVALDAPFVPAPAPAEVAALLAQSLDRGVLALLRDVAAVAEAQGAGLYLVGGAVRDVLLGSAIDDLDLVVAGDAVALAELLAASAGLPVRSHRQFGTASITLGSPSLTLDLVSARSEHYPRPAALPEVTPAALRHDLHRRDFTVNTMAVALGPSHYGQLLDYDGGRRDLERGVMRVLHRQSFVDDPTRLLRLSRLAPRLELAVEPLTRSLIDEAVTAGVCAQTTPARLANELRLLLHEPAPERCLALLADWGLLQALHPALRWNNQLAAQIVAARSSPWAAEEQAERCLGVLTYHFSDAERAALVARYNLGAAHARLLRELGAVQSLRPRLAAADMLDSTLDQLLHSFLPTTLHVAQLMEAPPLAERIGRYEAVLRPQATVLSGKDVLALGVPAGPALGRLLAELRAARLDGIVGSAADERAWVLARIGDGA